MRDKRDPVIAATLGPHVVPRGTPRPVFARASSAHLDHDSNDFSVEAPTVARPDIVELVLQPGERVEQYEIIRELGRGGMGVVYMARDTRLGRLVAIKFLTNTTEETSRRFLVEAKTTARCMHENIVVIYDADTYKQYPYMVLEYLEGTPLAQIIKDRALSAARTVEIIVPLVRALTRAHASGIVHRDLKPENIFITGTGAVKVLDFGVAKLFGEPEEPISKLDPNSSLYETLSTGGRVVGTLPYMSPEQFNNDLVDERADIWATGIILFKMLSGLHPLNEPSLPALVYAAKVLDQPLRSLGEVAPNAPKRLVRIVDKCLRKHKTERYATADQLLAELEPLLPARRGRRLGDEECPYPGLSVFEEGDADRFFGRSREIARAMALLRDNPMLAMVGPSGAGKSSFVRAGLIPELKSSGAAWETFIVRPGRDPLASFAPLVEACVGYAVDVPQLAAKLRAEPGYLGVILREYARQKQTRVLVMVDQFEELYTLVADEAERMIATKILHTIADDPTSPLRLVLSLRSDFLHRVVENEAFASAVMRSVLLLGPPDRQALREAIVGPAEKVDYHFESEQMVEDVIGELTSSVAPYPLLQFCLATLWSHRDTADRRLTNESFRTIGGVAGALASHADTVIQTLSHNAQRAARTIFQRLVTSEGTRALVDVVDLERSDTEARSVLATLVEARLVVRHDDSSTVEIVHEALITQWPMLRRWLDESREDTTFLEQVRAAARQWDAMKRSPGLLWRGAAVADARRFVERHGDVSLQLRERDFLQAVITHEQAAARRRRIVVSFVMAILTVAAVAAGGAALWIREAQLEASSAQERSQKAAILAQREAERAQTAERKAAEQLEMLKKSEADRTAAAAEAEAAASRAESAAAEAAQRRSEAELSKEQLIAAFGKLKAALARAELARAKAETATKSEQDARHQLQEALDREKERVKKLEEQRGKIVDKL